MFHSICKCNHHIWLKHVQKSVDETDCYQQNWLYEQEAENNMTTYKTVKHFICRCLTLSHVYVPLCFLVLNSVNNIADELTPFNRLVNRIFNHLDLSRNLGSHIISYWFWARCHIISSTNLSTNHNTRSSCKCYTTCYTTCYTSSYKTPTANPSDLSTA